MKNTTKNRGWIKIHRKITESTIWMCEPFTKAQAWIDILLMASHKKTTFFVRGNEITINRGQFAYAEETLSKKWKWSRNKTRRYLKWLETIQQIEQQKNRVLSVYTVLNYDLYQSDDTTNDTTDDTTERQQKVQQKDIYKNVNNVLVSKDTNDARRQDVDYVLDTFMEQFGQLPIDRKPRNVAWNLIRNYKTYLKTIGEDKPITEMVDIGFKAYKDKFPDMSVMRLDTVRLFLKSVMETKIKNSQKTYDKSHS